MRAPPVSTAKMSSRRSASCAAGRIRIRAAASSIASGRPSRRRQICRTAAALSSVTRNDGRTSWARCSKRRTASEPPSAAAVAVTTAPPGGSDSGGTGQLHSPSTPSGSRLVARIDSAGQATSSRSARPATAAARCSQLSSTISVRRPDTCAAIASAASCPGVSGAPSWLATVWPTDAGSAAGASSTQQTPPGKVSPATAAAASASRVLPVPPGPVRVSSLVVASSCRTSRNSLARPTSDVRRTGGRPAVSVAIDARPLCRPKLSFQNLDAFIASYEGRPPAVQCGAPTGVSPWPPCGSPGAAHEAC